MNILAIFFHFPPISGGGVVVATEIVNNLIKTGNNVTVITPQLKWSGAVYEPIIHKSAKIIRVKIPASDKMKIAARLCKNSLRKAGQKAGKESKFDFIFTIFHPFHLASHAAIDCGKSLKIPVMIKVDDALYPPTTSSFKGIQRRIEKYYNSKILKSASFILVSNNATKKIVNNFYNVDENKIHIIPNGVDTMKFKKSNSNSKKIIFSGVMYSHVGLDVLIQSVPMILESIPDVSVELYGEGPELEKLQSLVKEKNLEKNVHFNGWAASHDVPEILSQASVGVGPLINTIVTQGALPIKVLEYIASSLPIVAAFGTLPDDILIDTKNGFLIQNHNDLALKLVDILSNDEKQTSMGDASRNIALKFDWKIIAQKIEELFKVS